MDYQNGPSGKGKFFTRSLLIFIIIVLLCLSFVFAIYGLIVKNNNLSNLYQNKVSELKIVQDKIDESEAEILRLSSQLSATCPKPIPIDCETQASPLAKILPTECSAFTYSNWSNCSSSGIQTRTVVSTLPTGCTGGILVQNALSQKCTPPVISCDSFTYSNWSDCLGEIQTRAVISRLPTGCSGGKLSLIQGCTPPVVSCGSFIYSNWGNCSNGTQTRTVTSKLPSGCVGGSPLVSQTCSPPPIVDIKADGQDGIIIINSPRNVVYSFSAVNADIGTSCQLSRDSDSDHFSADATLMFGKISIYMDKSTIFTLSCTGPGGSASDSGGVSLVP